MSPQPKLPRLYGFSLMEGVPVKEESLRIDMLMIRYKVTSLDLIQERGTIMVQGFKEANSSKGKALKHKTQDLGF